MTAAVRKQTDSNIEASSCSGQLIFFFFELERTLQTARGEKLSTALLRYKLCVYNNICLGKTWPTGTIVAWWFQWLPTSFRFIFTPKEGVTHSQDGFSAFS